ncbi:MAG: phosphoribosylglycinamide formyltransferase, partial [Bacteroidetes bacterium HGW-Bacteroidetes-21]
MKKIVLFASGSGSNAENIIHYFNENGKASVLCVYTNNPAAGVIERCGRLDIPCRIFNREEWNTGVVTEEMVCLKPNLVVLAGFLWLVPKSFVEAFPQKIVNIHPALLPKYGGKGMYGDFVHAAVSDAGDTETGITIHYVNEQYDKGSIIFQKSMKIKAHATPQEIAAGIHH